MAKQNMADLSIKYIFIDQLTRPTIEPVDGILPLSASDASIDPLELVSLVLHEILEDVQNFCHLQFNRINSNWRFQRANSGYQII